LHIASVDIIRVECLLAASIGMSRACVTDSHSGAALRRSVTLLISQSGSARAHGFRAVPTSQRLAGDPAGASIGDVTGRTFRARALAPVGKRVVEGNRVRRLRLQGSWACILSQCDRDWA